MPAPSSLKDPYGLSPVYSVRGNGELWLYEHNNPAGGTFAWGDARRIGGGWFGRTLAGPSGYLFSITGSGELRLLHYTGSTWDGPYSVIGQGWQYASAATRNRISVDEDGVLYTLDSAGNLKAWYYNVAARKWDVLGALLETGLTNHSAIIATSRGVVYVRSNSGGLFRYYIDFWTNANAPTWVRPTTAIGSGWQGFTQFSSPGGDIIYAVYTGDNNLYWASYDPVAKKWATSTVKLIGYGWGGLQDVVSQSNACTRFDPARGASSEGPTDGDAVVKRLNAVRKN